MSLLIDVYSTLIEPPAIDFACYNMKQRSLEAPAMADHLNGFIGYILQAGDGQMNARRYALYRHLQRVKQQFSFEIEEAELTNFADWGWRANVVAFLPDGTVRNPDGAVLQYPDGEVDLDAVMPYPADALARKANTEHYLETLVLYPPISLPPVVGEQEVILRSAREVAERALALLLTAIQAESFRNNQPMPPQQLAERCPTGFKALSPVERAFIASTNPEQQILVNMSWRYEALAVLEWALGWQQQLTFPSQLANVPQLVAKALEYSKQDLVGISLRATGELLDSLDLHYRLHWLARDCRIKEQKIVIIDESIIQERHYVLNWLTCFENKKWDEVDTPT